MYKSAREATTQLFQLYGDEIYRYALFVLANSADAQDVVQEVFTRVFNSWNSFRHQSNERTWLWSITRNYLTDLKRRRRWRTISLDRDVSLDALLPSVHMSKIHDWEDTLRAMSLPHRQVIYWIIIHNLPVSDTAEVLGWTDTKVRVTLHRAIRSLRQMVANEYSARGKGCENHGLERH